MAPTGTGPTLRRWSRYALVAVLLVGGLLALALRRPVPGVLALGLGVLLAVVAALEAAGYGPAATTRGRTLGGVLVLVGALVVAVVSMVVVVLLAGGAGDAGPTAYLLIGVVGVVSLAVAASMLRTLLRRR